MKVGARLSVCAVVTSLASARNFTDLGPCGRAGRWGETVEEKLFFLKTIKTAGSTTRFAFMRFARGERMATLRANAPGGILFALDGSNQRWLPRDKMRAVPGGSRPRPPGSAPYDIAADHSTLDLARLREALPGARWVTVSRPVLSRVKSAMKMFHNEATPHAYFKDSCARASSAGLCQGRPRRLPPQDTLHIWNSIAWQMGIKLPRIDLGDTERMAAVLALVNVTPVVKRIEGIGAETFSLTMLTERYDESLVLLRSLLCWRWLDVLTPEPPLSPIQQSGAARLAAKRKRAAAVRADPLNGTLDRTILELNPVDMAIHEAAVRRFAAHVDAYGGAEVLARDVRFFRSFRMAVAVTCLQCRAPTGSQPPAPAYGAVPCAALRETCDELQYQVLPAVSNHRGSAAAIRQAIEARRHNEAEAEHAIVYLLDGCEEHMATVRVCSRHKTCCATGDLCTRGMAEVPTQLNF